MSGKLWALVMAGGQGTRLWPLSRKDNPKQLHVLYGHKPLIAQTIERVRKLVPPQRIYIISDQKNCAKIARLVPFIPKKQIIGEPTARNTAATIGLAASLIARRDPHAILSVFPSDHYILNQSAFSKSVRHAVRWAAKGMHHVLFGVKPTFPSTAYGYVDCARHGSEKNLFVVRRYIEKPDRERAAKLFQKKNYYWQAGIFVFQVSAILDSLCRFLPQHHEVLSRIANAWKDGKPFPLKKQFSGLKNISIDYGVMEKLEKIYMVPASFDWNDIGSWNALESIWSRDAGRNSLLGKSVAYHAKRNIVYSPERLTCLLGVQDLVVIDSSDALLVCSKREAEKVKELVQLLKARRMEKYL